LFLNRGKIAFGKASPLEIWRIDSKTRGTIWFSNVRSAVSKAAWDVLKQQAIGKQSASKLSL
jgi:hypothetical protein